MTVRPYRDVHRRKCRQIRVGKVLVGGDAPISVQTMTNTLTADANATIAQILQAEAAGADIVRVSCPDEESTAALSQITLLFNYASNRVTNRGPSNLSGTGFQPDIVEVPGIRLDLVARQGFGYLIGFLGANGAYDSMYAVVLTVALLGFAADRGFQLIMNRMLQWREQTP